MEPRTYQEAIEEGAKYRQPGQLNAAHPDTARLIAFLYRVRPQQALDDMQQVINENNED